MAEHVWSILCSSSIVDKQTNNISLLGLIDQVTIPATPDGTAKMLPISCEFISLWKKTAEASPEKFQTQVLFKTPDGETANPASVIDVSILKKRTRVKAIINGLLIKAPGTHFFLLQKRNSLTDSWVDVTTVPLDVNFTG